MISRTPFAIAVAVTSVLGLIATDAVADPVVDRNKDPTRRAIHRTVQQRHLGRNALGYAQYNNKAPWDSCRGPWTFCWGYHVAPPVPIVRYPGYLYAPRIGIINEACNLPTSACPNEQRDVNY
jgi:hypothetical protein